MRSVLVKVADAGPSEPNSVALAEYDHVIEELAAAPADPTFGHGILTGTSIGGAASKGKASLSCWMTQVALGLKVALE